MRLSPISKKAIIAVIAGPKHNSGEYNEISRCLIAYMIERNANDASMLAMNIYSHTFIGKSKSALKSRGATRIKLTIAITAEYYFENIVEGVF